MIEFDTIFIDKECREDINEFIVLGISEENKWDSTTRMYNTVLYSDRDYVMIPNHFNNKINVGELIQVFTSNLNIRGVRCKSIGEIFYYYPPSTSFLSQKSDINRIAIELNPNLSSEIEDRINNLPILFKILSSLEDEYSKIVNKGNVFLIEKDRYIHMLEIIYKGYKLPKYYRNFKHDLDAYESVELNNSIKNIKMNSKDNFFCISKRMSLIMNLDIDNTMQKNIINNILEELNCGFDYDTMKDLKEYL